MWGLYLNFKLLVFEDIIVTFAIFAQATQEEFLISMFDMNKGTWTANIYTVRIRLYFIQFEFWFWQKIVLSRFDLMWGFEFEFKIVGPIL